VSSFPLAHAALVAAAWLLTYLLHSTALLGGVWLLVTRVRRIPLRWQDRAWKLALTGGLATASVQVGLGIEPFGGRVVLAGTALAREASETPHAGAGGAAARPEEAPEEAIVRVLERGAGRAGAPSGGRVVLPSITLVPEAPDARVAQHADPGDATPGAAVRPKEARLRVLERETAADAASGGPSGGAALEPALLAVAVDAAVAIEPAEPTGAVQRAGIGRPGASPAIAADAIGPAAARPGAGRDLHLLRVRHASPDAMRASDPNGTASTSDALPLAAEVASRPWLVALWALWLAGAAVGLVAFARALRRLRAHLAGRVVLDAGPLRERLDALCARAGVRSNIRLTASPHVAAPLTHGILRREICVPARALDELSPTQQEAMLGHELGHAIRRDPAWLGVCWMLERVLLVQPLNRVARVRLQHNAEMLCDDWAVHLTGRRLSLASCLTEVAQWVVGRPAALSAPGLAPASSMAGAPLTQRVERLLASPPREVARGERWWLAVALAALGAVAGAAPGFAATLRRAPAPDRAPGPEPGEEPADVRERRAERDLDAESTPALRGSAAPATTATADAPPALVGASTPPAAASAPRDDLSAAIAALDEELDLALADLRDLKRAVATAGAVERFAGRLDALERNVAALLAQREAVHTLLPRVLESLETAPETSPSPLPRDPFPLRNESR
jgi:beta-lactamase regulating signal transducer with metallopeptidase domain